MSSSESVATPSCWTRVFSRLSSEASAVYNNPKEKLGGYWNASKDTWEKTPPPVKTAVALVGLCALTPWYVGVPAASWMLWRKAPPEVRDLGADVYKQVKDSHPSLAHAAQTIEPIAADLSNIRATAKEMLNPPAVEDPTPHLAGVLHAARGIRTRATQVLGVKSEEIEDRQDPKPAPIGPVENPKLQPEVSPAPPALHPAEPLPAPVFLEPEAAALAAMLEEPRPADPAILPVLPPTADSTALQPVQDLAEVLPIHAVEEPLTVTAACGSKALVEATPWSKKTDEILDRMSLNLTDFSIFLLLHFYVCKMKDEGEEVIDLVRKAALPENKNVSRWRLFVDQYKLTWTDLKWWTSGIVHFFTVSMSSLIPNTVDTYVREIFSEMRLKLTDDKNKEQNLTEVVKQGLDAFDEFFEAHNAAGRVYASQIDSQGTIDQVRHRKIAGLYGWTPDPKDAYDKLSESPKLYALCRKFSDVIVRRFSPHVPFFKDWKKARGIGVIFNYPPFSWIDKALNMLTRWVMRKYILPSSIQSMIASGIDMAKPTNKRFGIAIMDFATGQLAKLNAKIKKGDVGDDELPLPPGAEKLPTIVKKLKEALDLFPFGERAELAKKIKELDEGGGLLDPIVQKSIQEGIRDGATLLFHFLTDPDKEKTEELFTNLGELSLTVFGPKDTRSPEKLNEDYETSRWNMKTEAHDGFHTIIENAVAKIVKQERPEKALELTETSFQAQKQEARGAFDQLSSLCERIGEKVKADDGSSAQTEIASFAKVLETFATRERMQDQMKGLSKKDKAAIWQVLTPVYKQIALLPDPLAQLQESQTKYLSHLMFTKRLAEIKHLILNPAGDPVEYRKTMEEALREIRDHLPQNAKGIPELELSIQKAADFFRAIDKEQQAIGGLYAVFPPLNENGSKLEKGLIEQLVDYYDASKEKQAGFKPYECREQIKACLSHLDPNEQKAVNNQINNLIKVPANSTREVEWEAFREVMRGIRASRMNRLEGQLSKLDKLQKNIVPKIEQMIHLYGIEKEKNHQAMLKNMEEMSRVLDQLKREASLLQAIPRKSLNDKQWGLLAAAAGALFGAAAGPVWSAAVGVGVPVLVDSLKQDPVDVVKNAAGAGTTAAAGTFAASRVLSGLPFVGPALSAATPYASAAMGAAGLGIAGANAPKQLTGAFTDKVLPTVETIFDNAEALARSDNLYHGICTSLMRKMIVAFS